MLPVTSLYAGLLALMLFALSIYVIRGRYKYKVGLSDGGEQDMMRRIRAQANFCEYVPFVLLLMAMAELQNAMHPILHLIGLLILVGRVCHASSLLYLEPNGKGFKLRMAGMIMSFTALLFGACYALFAAFSV